METISLSYGDGIGITPEGYFRVNRVKTFNPKYIELIGANETQRAFINRYTTTETTTETITAKKQEKEGWLERKENEIEDNKKQDLDHELNQLIVMDKLKKKINTVNIHADKLDQYKQYCSNEDDKILTERKLQKAKDIVLKYLETLKADPKYNIQRIAETCYKMVYNGSYVTARKMGNITAEGVF